MPIPQPHAGEDEDGFHGRCMSEIWDEYGEDPAQANAICFAAWRKHEKTVEKSMNGGPKRLYGAIEKVEDVGDGTVKVHGIASTEDEDDQGEIVRATAMREAIPGYMKFGAVREMHGLTAAGRALECDCTDDNVTRIVAHVVDPTAVLKVRNRVYNGFSIGGRVLERESGNYKAISKLALHEISLVDRPANPQATIDLWKASGDRPMPDGGLNQLGDAFADALAKTQQYWRCGNLQHMHLRKEDAAKCMAKAAEVRGKQFPNASPPFGDAEKTGLPGGGEVPLHDPPGDPKPETNFDGDHDADDASSSPESAGHGFKPEGDADRAEDFGKVKYADPGYQDDKKPRYPLNTEKRVRAAWSYINQSDNARLYSGDQLSRVKASIRSAAKDYGIEISEKAVFDLGDPEALIKALAGSSLDVLLDDLPYDGEIGKAGARQSAADAFVKNMIHDGLAKLSDGQFCVKKAANATQDTSGNPEHSAPDPGPDSGAAHYRQNENATQDTSKRGARHSSATIGFLKKAHDNVVRAGASCPAHDEVGKASTEEGAMSALTASPGEQSDEIALALRKALKENKKLRKAMGNMEHQVQNMQVHMEYLAKNRDASAPLPPPAPIPERGGGKLKKAVADALAEQLAPIRETVDQIAKQPVPGSASKLPPGIMEISKAQDGQGGAPNEQLRLAEEYAKTWASMTPDDRFAASYHVSKTRPFVPPR